MQNYDEFIIILNLNLNLLKQSQKEKTLWTPQYPLLKGPIPDAPLSQKRLMTVLVSFFMLHLNFEAMYHSAILFFVSVLAL